MWTEIPRPTQDPDVVIAGDLEELTALVDDDEVALIVGEDICTPCNQ